MKPEESLKLHFRTVLILPEDAVDWLMMVWSSIQTFDDFADGDSVSRKRIDELIWNMTIAMPQNPFYYKHSQSLWSVMATAILKWQASDKIEREGRADAMSFAWRAGFYDIVLFVYALVHGHGVATRDAHLVMKLYGENFEDYIKEINHA